MHIRLHACSFICTLFEYTKAITPRIFLGQNLYIHMHIHAYLRASIDQYICKWWICIYVSQQYLTCFGQHSLTLPAFNFETQINLIVHPCAISLHISHSFSLSVSLSLSLARSLARSLTQLNKKTLCELIDACQAAVCVCLHTHTHTHIHTHTYIHTHTIWLSIYIFISISVCALGSRGLMVWGLSFWAWIYIWA